MRSMRSGVVTLEPSRQRFEGREGEQETLRRFDRAQVAAVRDCHPVVGRPELKTARLRKTSAVALLVVE
jgi:hypothetical protein